MLKKKIWKPERSKLNKIKVSKDSENIAQVLILKTKYFSTTNSTPTSHTNSNSRSTASWRRFFWIKLINCLCTPPIPSIYFAKSYKSKKNKNRNRIRPSNRRGFKTRLKRTNIKSNKRKRKSARTLLKPWRISVWRLLIKIMIRNMDS
jgi:hypothetical protein